MHLFWILWEFMLQYLKMLSSFVWNVVFFHSLFEESLINSQDLTEYLLQELLSEVPNLVKQPLLVIYSLYIYLSWHLTYWHFFITSLSPSLDLCITKGKVHSNSSLGLQGLVSIQKCAQWYLLKLTQTSAKK